MTLPIRIVVRTDVDWANMTWEKFLSQKYTYQPTMAILEMKRHVAKGTVPESALLNTPQERGGMIRQWEIATGRSYFQYRGEVRALCLNELRKIKGVDVTVGLHRENEWLDGIRDEILIPLDDDDIIYPNVTSIAQYFTDGVGVVLWNRLTDFCFGERKVLIPRAYLDTNNYAVRKSFLLDWPNHLAGHFLNNHQAANSMLRKRLALTEPTMFQRIMMGDRTLRVRSGTRPIRHSCIKEVDENYSIYFLHSASISFLMKKMPQNVDPVEYLRSLPLHPLIERAIAKVG